MKKEFFEIEPGAVIRILPSGSMYSYSNKGISVYPLYNKIKSKSEIRIMKIKKTFNI